VKRILLLLLLLAIGCSRDSSKEVVVFTSHDRIFSEPILDAFEKKTGLKVRIVTDTEATKTTGLVNRLLVRKSNPEADVFWNNEIGRTLLLQQAGVLAPYKPSSGADVSPAFKDPDGYWTGFAARARVILYNTKLVRASEAPKSLWDLTLPRWKGKVAIANPLFGTTATHLAALFAVLGPEKAKDLLRKLKANGVSWVAGNAVARNLVMDGQMAICLTDTDDANGAFRKNKPVAMVYPDQQGIGTLLIPNTVCLIAGGPNPRGAKLLIEYLISLEVEGRLAQSPAAQIPLRPGVAVHSERFSGRGRKWMAATPKQIAAQFAAVTAFVKKELID